MKPDARTVTQLFELAVRYVVPLYQRPYVCKEDDQWEPLWGDLATLLEHQANGDGQDYSHFTGAIVRSDVLETIDPISFGDIRAAGLKALGLNWPPCDLRSPGRRSSAAG
ncbi:MAG: hypothetical protein ACRDQ2_01715 [Gaiellales bacterium]